MARKKAASADSSLHDSASPEAAGVGRHHHPTTSLTLAAGAVGA